MCARLLRRLHSYASAGPYVTSPQWHRQLVCIPHAQATMRTNVRSGRRGSPRGQRVGALLSNLLIAGMRTCCAPFTPLWLSRPGARCRCCHRSGSPGRSPNPPCVFPRYAEFGIAWNMPSPGLCRVDGRCVWSGGSQWCGSSASSGRPFGLILSFAGAGCSGGGGVIMNRPSPSRVWVSGALQAYAAGFREELSVLWYSRRSAAGHLQLMAHLSRWLVEIGSAPDELTPSQVERFIQGRRDGSRVHRSLTLRGMQPLLDHLRRIGVVAAVGPAAASAGRDVVIE